MNSSLSKFKKSLAYISINFAAPICFYATFQLWGSKPAIALGIGVTFLQVLIHWYYEIQFSPFFIVSSGFIVLFGGVDLFLKTPRVFRLEPFFQNFILATLFFISIFTRVPLIARFAEALPLFIRPNLSKSGMQAYLKKLTLIWAIYLYLKAVLFLYLAFHVDLGKLIVLRSALGGGSLLILVAGEMLYRRWSEGKPR